MIRSSRLPQFFFILLIFDVLQIYAIAQGTTAHSEEIQQRGKQAEIYLHKQEYALAASEYQEILTLDPGNLDAHSNLGLTYYLQQQFAPAAEQFDIALATRPNLWNIAALCGLSEARIQQNGKAVPHLQVAFDHVTDPSLRLVVGKQLFSILSESGDLNRASEIVGKLQELDPSNAEILYAEHRVYLLLANRAFQTIAYSSPDSARMYQVWGDRMKLMGDAHGAIVAYRQAIQRDADIATIHASLADVLSVSRSSADQADAEREYRKALQLDPDNSHAESMLGDLALNRSDIQEASQHYRRALKIQPDDPIANEGLGEVLMQSQSYKEARAYLERAVHLDPTNRSAYYHLSQADRKLGRNTDAKQEMSEFLRLKTEDEKMRNSFDSMPLRSAEKPPQQGEQDVAQPTGSAGSNSSPRR
ncbi:MAG TPA: tetratricopeptide repeat protein [Terracidiphilus sp.]|nr:tetratricopeptide repeat protein [Terracidiphilus sp.]